MRIIIYLLFFTFTIQAQEVNIGAGSYNLSPPPVNGRTPENSTTQNTLPKVSPQFNQPIQTNDWWSSLLYKFYQNNNFLWEIHSWKLYAHPLVFVANRYGLDVRYPNSPTIENYYGMSNAKYQYAFDLQDFTIGLVGMDLSTTDTVKTDGYGDWHVKAIWDDGSGNTMKTTMAHGSPFVYVETIGNKPSYLRFFYNPIINHTIGNNILGITVNGRHYGIFAPSGSTWNTDSTYVHDENAFVSGTPNLMARKTFVSSLNNKGYFSIALLPDNSLNTLQDFSQYAFSFISDTQVSWDYNTRDNILNSTFETITEIKEGSESRTLQALYPHQWKNSSDINTNYTYISPRGLMKITQGNIFKTELQHYGLLPALPLILDETKKTELYDMIDHEYQVNQPFTPFNDSYRLGKRLGRLSDLVYLADQVGHELAKNKFITNLKTELEDWFTAPDGESNRGYFYYDENWNTLIGYPASYGTNTQLNDHHFHYGYFIKAATTVSFFDPVWSSDENWGGMVKLLIKDVNNWDRTDSQFPFLRYFDSYAGHSWANGHGNFHFGNEQESSSEALNFASWVYFFGLNTQNEEIKNLGLFLYLNEAEAVRQYWFDEDQDIFPNNYGYVSASRIWGNGADKVVGSEAYLQESEYQLGINTFPIQAPLLYLGVNPVSVMDNYSEAQSIGDGVGDLWEDIMWGYQAIYDPSSALTDYESHTINGTYTSNIPQVPDASGIYQDFSHEGLAPSQIFHWLNVLDSIGTICTDITSGYSGAMVFKNETDTTFVIYNPSDSEITVRFYPLDLHLTAPPQTLHTHTLSPPKPRPKFNVIFQPSPIRLVLQRMENNIKVYPNPIHKNDILEIDIPQQNEILNLDIYNVTGEKIQSFQINGNHQGFQIDLESMYLNSGIYFIRSWNGKEQIFLEKIVVH